MSRRTKHNDGLFHINGHKYREIHGSRVKVMNGTAYETNGGLRKSDLKYNKAGRIVSILKSKTAKKERRLEKAGYFTEKGKFGFVKKDVKTRKNRTRKN
jgi:DVNP family